MGWYDAAKALLFRLDAERVHEWALALISRGMFQARDPKDTRLAQTLFGVRFDNPLGLAAGFDKSGLAIEQWEDLGFGFAEIGTVTRHRQEGNPRPRLFRLAAQEALVNRMGFNNDGATVVSNRLRESRPSIPIGVNIGKSAATPLSDAPRDYLDCFRSLKPFAAYVTVNVSSPNTPGLRSLQDRGALTEIVAALRDDDPEKPVLVKVSPDLEPCALDDVIRVVHETGAAGIVATNTTVRREMLSENPGIEGGLSGRPLKPLADSALAHLAGACDPQVTLVASGGIFTGRDLFDKTALGAHLCQAYTGFVYRGPRFAELALVELTQRMDAAGAASLASIRGKRELIAAAGQDLRTTRP